MANADKINIGEFPLPSGAVIVLTDPENMTGDDFKRVLGSVKGDPTQDEARIMGAGIELIHTLACTLIESWSVPYLPGLLPPSREPAHLGRLRLGDYTATLNLVKPALPLVFAGLSSVTVDDAETPGSPTEPAAA